MVVTFLLFELLDLPARIYLLFVQFFIVKRILFLQSQWDGLSPARNRTVSRPVRLPRPNKNFHVWLNSS